MSCYICDSNNHVDDHHYDCQGGKLNAETVPLCRRCHRTYHDLGLEWFEDEYLDKAIEIENKRREIWNNEKGVIHPFPLIKREDIKRTAYWNKKHGIKPDHPSITKGRLTPTFQFHLPHGEPLCGWEWVNAHLYDLIDWVPRIEIIHPNLHLTLDIDSKAKLKEAVKVLRGMKNAG